MLGLEHLQKSNYFRQSRPLFDHVRLQRKLIYLKKKNTFLLFVCLSILFLIQEKEMYIRFMSEPIFNNVFI
jgi:hypothetical protein